MCSNYIYSGRIPDTIHDALCISTRAIALDHDTAQQMHILEMLQVFSERQCSTPDLVNFGNCQEPNPGTRSLSNY